jgi:hypothetical protein
MRFVIVLLILALAGFTAHAISYSNDSDSIDIDYSGGSPVIPDEEAPEDAPGGESPAGNTGTTGNNSPATGSEDGTFTEESPDVTISVSEGEGGSENGNSEDTSSEEDILNTLFGNQALLFGGGSGASDSITLSGEKLRAALKARGIERLELSDLLGKRFKSKKDFALAAASSVLENEAIQEVVLTLDTLSLTYRAEGRLFAVFPLSYPVTLTIDPSGGTREERIRVTFPWWRFFLQTFVSRSELQNAIDNAISPVLEGERDSIDARTRLFLAVTNAIDARFDTVQGSLR